MCLAQVGIWIFKFNFSRRMWHFNIIYATKMCITVRMHGISRPEAVYINPAICDSEVQVITSTYNLLDTFHGVMYKIYQRRNFWLHANVVAMPAAPVAYGSTVWILGS